MYVNSCQLIANIGEKHISNNKCITKHLSFDLDDATSMN